MKRLLCPLALLLLAAPARAADYTMDYKVADVRLGSPVLASIKDADLKGRVVLLEFWGINCPKCRSTLPHVNDLARELGPFGLVTVGSHLQGKPTAAQIKTGALAFGANFPLVESTSIPGMNDVDGIPHVVLFDHRGKCVFRGDPTKVDGPARKALAAYLVDVKTKAPLTGDAAELVLSLRKGAEPTKVLAEAVTLAKSDDKKQAAEAKVVLEHLTAAAGDRMAWAEKQAEQQPLEAYDQAAFLATAFKDTAVAAKAEALTGKLKDHKVVAPELKARPLLEAIRKLDKTLSARPGAKTAPKGDEFHKANRFPLRQMQARLAQAHKAAPKAKATAEATRIAAWYGITAE